MLTDPGRTHFDAEISGLDALDLAEAPRIGLGRRIWATTWPKLLAIAIALLIWQLVFWSGWKPDYVLPSPSSVFGRLFSEWSKAMEGAGTTLRRAGVGFTIAVVIGSVVGALVSRSKVLRSGIGSMITGLQTMPSVAWFPAAIALFKLGEGAILFVVILGAAPAVANGLIAGVDQIPPLLVRAGHVLGARRTKLFRFVIAPAAVPAYVTGLKQGWAFAWRSLMAGELIVLIAGKTSLGQQLQANKDLNDMVGLYATMVVIFVIGVLVDSVVFGNLERFVRHRYGLDDSGD
ncbi:MAG: Binding-protein-dependent transport system inner rane component [Actinomycetia bacterium]|nr:Binding-protein-dependent transport system inner rane component [Actinomycetes bacterium]